jgi:MFS family permease
MVTMSASPLMVSMLVTAFTVPCIALALPSGLLADRLDRRKILIWSQTAQALAALLLAVATWCHVVSPALLLVESGLLGLAVSVSSPPWQSLVPELAGRKHITEAVTLNSIAFNLARATGPALGGLVLGLWGAGWAFALNALSFLCVVWVLVRYDAVRRASELPRNTPASANKEPLFRSMIAPIRLVTENVRMRSIFVCVAVFAFSAASVPAMLPVLAKRSLHASATGYGLMLCAMGVGAVSSGLVLRRVRRSMGPRVVVVSAMIAYGAFVVGIGLSPSLPWAIALLVGMGMGWLGCLSTLNALAQLSSPAWIKSRMMALYNMSFFFVWSLGAVFGGALASRWGERTAIVFSGAATLLAAIVAAKSALPAKDISADEPASVREPVSSHSTEIAGPKAA